ncbi:MAG: hypothetical protein U9N49_06275 [Campylobacterota bacterium]|nr:hypothetical protein [Campylobacterota bacterium]
MVKIIVEGDGDKKLIEELLNHLAKNREIPKVDFRALIIHMGSKKKLLNASDPKYIKILTPEVRNDKMKKALFLFDCDFEQDDKECNGMENSQKCFENLLEQLKWDIPIDHHIFDRNLDYFLIETIKDKECYEHFDNLIECLEVESIKPNKKPIAKLYKDLYPYPKFDFEDERFKPLKTKLTNLFKIEEV